MKVVCAKGVHNKRTRQAVWNTLLQECKEKRYANIVMGSKGLMSGYMLLVLMVSLAQGLNKGECAVVETPARLRGVAQCDGRLGAWGKDEVRAFPAVEK